MVQQHANNKVTSNHIEEMNEFQLVHALITQSPKGSEKEATTASTSDEKVNERRRSSAHSMIISSICQTFNAFQTSDRKQFFPTSVKDILSRFRQLHQSTLNANSNTKKPSTRLTQQQHKNHPTKDKVISPALSTCVIRHASVQQSVSLENPSKQQDEQMTAPSSLKMTSNVHEKVLHFENCAIPSPTTPNAEVIPPEPSRLSPPSGQAVSEVCAGGTIYNLSPEPPTKTAPTPASEQEPTARITVKEPTPQPPPKLGTGRNLKRVPSKRFQRMRSKVQRLMTSKVVSDSDNESVPNNPEVSDEASFLRSIRIPTQQGVQLCTIARLADHDLCRIFSYLDMRTLASVKCSCLDFKFLIETFDIRASDSKWTNDEKYLDDPCKQCRRYFRRGDMSMCRYHPKRYYSDPPYGRSYWMCCKKIDRNQPGCCTGLHDNNWHSN